MAIEKTLELVKSLNVHEHTAFEKYLESTFFNVSKEATKLHKAVAAGNFNSRQEYFKALFPGKKYDDKQYRYIASELNGHLEKFLMMRFLQKDPLMTDLITAETLAERDLKKSYRMLHREITTRQSFRDATWFMRQYEHGIHDLRFTVRDAERKAAPDYNTVIGHLDTFYLLAKLRLACESTNLANILQSSVDTGLYEKILELADDSRFAEEPLVGIYARIYRILTDPKNETAFNEAGMLLREQSEKIKPAELADLYQYLKNFCVRQVNSGNTEYVRILFNLYNDMLQNKPLMRHDYLSQWEFKNMVTISLRLGEHDWCEKFLNKYISFLRPEDRKNALTYNTAYFSFMKGEYRQAVRKLQEVEMTDVFYQLDSRVVILKCYYELNDTDAFFYQASAFRLFLMRNKSISAFQQTIYRNLIKYITGIERARFNRAKLQKIRQKIETQKNVADVAWLMNKIEEME